MTERMEPILDPRWPQARPKLTLAARPTMEELQKGKVLFYNNTKLDFCNYREVFVRIKKHFEDAGIRSFVDFRETVRGKTTQDLRDYARKLAAAKPSAAVLALGDMGTTPATAIVAIALEELGVPTVYVTAPPGSQLAEAVAFYQAGRLCLCPLDIYQGSTREDVHAEVDKKIRFIFDCLTLPPEQISKCAHVAFELDKTPPAETLDFAHGAGMQEVMDLFDALRIGDGLPVIPPTASRLERMLAYCPWAPETPLAKEIGPTGKDITVREVAAAAVMAGCKPQYMPVLVTAFRCMSDRKYNFLQSVSTSHPGGNLVLVITPDHGRLLAREGWDKDGIRRHIHERAHHETPMVRNRGIVPVRPPDFADRHPMPVTRTPKDIEVVVAGNRGGHSAVILPWALHSEAVVLPVLLPDGKVAGSIEDFKV